MRSGYLVCEERELHYTEWGAQHREAVIAWHGLARTGRDMDDIAAHLAQRYRVICPDTIGRGLSQWSPKPEAEYCLDFYSRIARSLVDQLGLERFHWVGTSMGGAIGMVHFNGDLNTGLTLRTIRIKDGIAEVRAGATLLFDSIPEDEEAETELKASAMLSAIRDAKAGNAAATERADTAPAAATVVAEVDDTLVEQRDEQQVAPVVPAAAPMLEEPVVEEHIEYVHLVDEDDIPLTWEPVPVPRPTYTMKARAERPEVPPAEVTPDAAPVEVPADEGMPERRVAGA